ncbi:hypothetical protein F5984_18855 [Rudanella paleaurantiibacter]|uniref:Late embryogenesis abundant protein LEA-2 subgroup domain-containing protein n=1 Tax=Rudanella paleaurantiibacter TaxID=2614655 RepID=A0A7J5TW19_9BACT|nr:hypothetical protein [Rudanella paleaurantiibacter]KAB7728432.1 hypothetical protein F5984_18855 [Rudanella paleaurantiibacter]
MNALLLIGAAVMIWLFSKIRAGQMIDFSFGMPVQFRVQSGYLVFVQPVELINQTNTAVTLQQVNLDFRATGGARLGSAYLGGFYRLPGLGRITIPVEVRTNLIDLIRAFPDLRNQYQGRKIDIRYVGTIRAEGVTLPIDERFEMPFNFLIPS